MDSGPLPRKRRKFLWLFFAGILAILLVGAVLWRLGVPQRRLLAYLAGDRLDADIEVGQVDLYPELRINRLAFTPRDSASPIQYVEIEDPQVSYQFRPEDGRYIDIVEAGRIAIGIHDSEGKGFSLFSMGEGGTALAIAWIPKRLRVHEIAMDAVTPTWTVRLDGLAVEATLESLDDMTARVSGAPHLKAQTQAPGLADIEERGVIDLTGAYDHGRIEVKGAAALGDLATMKGLMSADLSDSADQRMFLDIEEGRLKGGLWGELLSTFLPLPVRFATVEATGVHVEAHRREGVITFPEVRGDVSATDLVVGELESPLYAGSPQMLLEGSQGGESQFNAVVQLGLSHPLVFAAETVEELKLTASFDSWSRADLDNIVPAGYQQFLGYVPGLDTLGAQVEYQGVANKGVTNGVLDAGLGGGGAARVSWEGLVDRGEEATALFAGTLKASLGEEAAEGAVRFASTEAFSGEFILRDFTPGTWLGAWTGKAIPGLQTRLNGTAQIEKQAGDRLQFSTLLDVSKAAYDIFALPEADVVKTALEGTLSMDGKALGITESEVSVGEDLSLSLRGIEASTDFAEAKGSLSGTFDLAYLATILGLSGLWGNLAVSGPFTWKDADGLQGTFSGSFDALGYSAWALPYRMPLTFDGPMHYAPDTGGVTAGPLSLTLGEGTRVDCGSAAIALPRENTPFHAELTALKIESDFEPLVKKGYLTLADGKAVLTSDTLETGGTEISGPVELVIDAAELGLPNGLGVLSGTQLTLDVAIGDVFSGGGHLRLQTLLIGGIDVSGMASSIETEGQRLVARDLTCTVFGGTVAASASVAPLEAGFPATLDATFENVDLDRFTKEFEPPSLILTGLLHGTVHLAFSREGLTALRVEMESTEGFTMNRDMVAEALERVREAGSNMALKVVEKVLGKEEQRPFDSAGLKLALEDGLLKGPLTLRSKALDLTVDLSAEPAALMAALQARQE